MKLKSKSFPNHGTLCKFINKWNITQDRIQQIVVEVHNYPTFIVFYWDFD